jgi:glycosyltransferase involved in cell wall biosynthesis
MPEPFRRHPLRVAWVGGEPTPTRVPHLQALAARPELDLTVFYATQTYQQRTWSIRHPEATILEGITIPATRLLHHDYPVTPSIWRHLQRGRFDLVVIAGWAVFAAQAAIVWCRAHGVPYLLNAENHLREPRRLWVRKVKGLVLPFVVPQAAGMLVSGTLAREHALYYGARPERVIVFPNTPDVPVLTGRADALRPGRDDVRSRFGIDHDVIVVLQVGRLIPVKGVDSLVESVAQARRQTGLPIRLVVVGEGPEKAALEALSAQCGVPLTLTGQLEGDALIEMYVAADVFTLLSRRETWGIVVNEAMAAGLPLVLSSAVGASGDLLETNGNGILVRPDDVPASAAAIAALAADPGMRAVYGARSREIIQDWGFDRSLDEFCKLAEQVVGEHADR